MQTVIAVIIAVIGSNGLWAYLQYRLTRKDEVSKALKSLGEKIDQINDKVDRNEATLARTHILRFDDEILNNGIHYHSLEYYRQTSEDIDAYERYANKNPAYRNNCATLAIDHIKRAYKQLQDEATEGGIDLCVENSGAAL